jgi:ABC-type multidrug transport system ATPase subunit
MNAVEIRCIKKKFGAVEALRGITFDVKEGEIYGLVGPDGAGKTALIRILTGIMSASSGSTTIGGVDVLKDPDSMRIFLKCLERKGKRGSRNSSNSAGSANSWTEGRMRFQEE